MWLRVCGHLLSESHYPRLFVTDSPLFIIPVTPEVKASFSLFSRWVNWVTQRLSLSSSRWQVVSPGLLTPSLGILRNLTVALKSVRATWEHRAPCPDIDSESFQNSLSARTNGWSKKLWAWVLWSLPWKGRVQRRKIPDGGNLWNPVWKNRGLETGREENIKQE